MNDPMRVPLRDVALEWSRIGVSGFGGPPTHIALLRRVVVERRSWISDHEFEDALAVSNLLPGPASTQLAIFCAWRVSGWRGAVIGGLGFIAPAVATIIALSAVFLAQSPPGWIRGAGAGAGAAVAAVALSAGLGLIRPSISRVRGSRSATVRWSMYLVAGAAAAAWLGPYLVLALLGCGLAELGRVAAGERKLCSLGLPFGLAGAGGGGLGALSWVALKVGALSFGGGFVIVPLMRADATHTYHWMTSTQFLTAVALGQVTPGPVVATIAAIGYAAHGVGGALLAAAIAFMPSFAFVLAGGGHFETLRRDRRVRAFLAGAGPAAIGAILGAAIPLAAALSETWQLAVLAAAAVTLVLARRGIVPTLLCAAVVGTVVSLAGGPLP